MEWVPIILLTFKATVLFVGMFFAIKWHHDQDRNQRIETGGSETSPDMRLFMTMIIALGMSLIGIVYAGCWGVAAHGGWGGALGCAFTFFMLLMSRRDAEEGLAGTAGQPGHGRIGQVQAPMGEDHGEVAVLKSQAERLRDALVIRVGALEREKIYLGVASTVSALAWKFGDTAAAWLKF
ncbi:MAG: hypothetical protein KGJ57_14815 [Sphingomonadales bacterium]|nr:hypothetical protein [Sphingomonadales bacterium]MDE2170675.1 hypothetical protein [Sphingomonadales bacterium]